MDAQNCKTLMKGRQDLEKSRDVPCSFSWCHSSLNQRTSWTQLLNKITLKFIWKGKGTEIANSSLEKQKEVSNHYPISRHCMITVVKTTWYWWRERERKSVNRIGNPEIVAHEYGQLIFGKDAKAVQRRKGGILRNGARATRYP